MTRTSGPVDAATPTQDERDDLTGLWTRGAFFARAEAAFTAAARSDTECVAVVIDLDRLELVNNTFGHHVGSELIREAAAALEAALTRQTRSSPDGQPMKG